MGTRDGTPLCRGEPRVGTLGLPPATSSSERSAVRTVLPASPVRRTVSLMDTRSARCSRRTSAQSSIRSTPFLPRRGGQGPRISTVSGGSPRTGSVFERR